MANVRDALLILLGDLLGAGDEAIGEAYALGKAAAAAKSGYDIAANKLDKDIAANSQAFNAAKVEAMLKELDNEIMAISPAAYSSVEAYMVELERVFDKYANRSHAYTHYTEQPFFDGFKQGSKDVADDLARDKGVTKGEIGFRWRTAEDEKVSFPANTKIKTKDGEKRIQDMKVGDLVLTHRDRYKRVLKTTKYKYYDQFVKITLSCSGRGKNKKQLTATADHPILTERGFVLAGDIKNTDKIMVVAKPCPECQRLMPEHNQVCSYSCGSKRANKKRWIDEREKNVKLVRSQNIERKSHLALHELDVQKKAKLTLAKHHGSFIEKKIEWFLKEENIQFVNQKYFGLDYHGPVKGLGKRFWVDFYLPDHNVIIEADGEQWHTAEKDKRRDEQLKRFFSGQILHFTGNQIMKDFLTVANEIRETIETNNCFVGVPIRSIKKWQLDRESSKKKFQVVYCLQVEEDQSYAANGIVVHNCTICNSLDGQWFALDVDMDVSWQSHVGCRCPEFFEYDTKPEEAF